MIVVKLAYTWKFKRSIHFFNRYLSNEVGDEAGGGGGGQEL